MTCKICALIDRALIDRIETGLIETKGALPSTVLRALCKEFPDKAPQLKAINTSDCELHFNFHQQVTRRVKQDNKETLAGTVDKDEAEVLYELLNAQMGTFTGLNNNINAALLEREKDLGAMYVHPTTLEFYKEIAASIRMTVRELRELNASINGSKDGTMEGLKALADAIRPAKQADDLTTKQFDD